MPLSFLLINASSVCLPVFTALASGNSYRAESLWYCYIITMGVVLNYLNKQNCTIYYDWPKNHEHILFILCASLWCAEVDYLLFRYLRYWKVLHITNPDAVTSICYGNNDKSASGI